MITSVEITQLIIAQKKNKTQTKKYSFDGAIINLGVVKKGMKKS